MRRVRLSILITLCLVAGAFCVTATAQFSQQETEVKDLDPNAVSSGGVCVPKEVGPRVTACPDNAPKPTKRKGGASAPKSRMHEVKRKKEKKVDTGPKGPGIQIDVATLRARKKVQARAKRLLMQEVNVTKRLINNTRKNDPRRPDFLPGK